MTQYAEFYSGTDWEGTSGPIITREFYYTDLWPQGTRSVSGTKDLIAAGLHPALAVGGMTEADGRPLNLCGVVVSYQNGHVELNIANYFASKQYVCNILTYSGGAPNTFEAAPVIGQPVYIDDSDDLGEGCTLSLSPLNTADLPNPKFGVLWYDQTEMPYNINVGGPNASNDWPPTWLGTIAEYLVTVLKTENSRDMDTL